MSATWKETWLPVVEQNLWENNYEILKSLATDDSSNVIRQGLYRKVYIPNAGTPAAVTVNGTSYPAAKSRRTDVVVDYNVDKFETLPQVVDRDDVLSVSYDKINSIVQDHVGALGEHMLYTSFGNWFPGVAAANSISTSGANVPGEATGATGNRKAFTVADVINAKKKLDKQKIKQTGRIMILPASLANQLLSDLTANGNLNFTFNETDAGLMKLSQNLFGFEIYMFSTVLNATSAGVLRPIGDAGATTDNEIGLAYQKEALSVAKDSVHFFINEGDATEYGDIMSAQAFMGSAIRRTDKKGIVSIVAAA